MGRAKAKRKISTGGISRRGRRKSKPSASLLYNNTSSPASSCSKGAATTPSSIAADVAALEFPALFFPLFPKLPPEIRHRIWAMAAEEQRVIILDQNRRRRPEFNLPPPPPAPPPPALLHVCAESRAVGLERYDLTFGRNGAPGRIYFNFDRDILFLLHQSGKMEQPRVRIAPVYSRDPFSALQLDGKERVRHLGYDLSARNDQSIACHWGLLGKWPKLECFYLGLRDGGLDLSERICCVPLPRERYKAFSAAFFRNRNFQNSQSPIPWTPLGRRMEWIRGECIYNDGRGDQNRYGRVREETRLVGMVNTSSLGVH